MEKKPPNLAMLIEMVEQAGMKNDPKTMGLLKAIAAGGPKANRLIKILMERISSKLAVSVYINDPYAPYPEKDIDGDVFVGWFFSNKKYFHVLLEELKHTLITGRTRIGKTTLVNGITYQLMLQGIICYFIDMKDDYKYMVSYFPDKMIIFDGSNLAINFFAVPDMFAGTPRDWAGIIVDIIGQSSYLMDGSRNLLLDVINDEYAKRGIFEGSKNYPTLIDIYENIKKRKVEYRSGGFKDSLINRFTGFKNSLGIDFSCKSLPWELILNKYSIVYRLGAYPENIKRLLAMYLFVTHYHRMNKQGQRGMGIKNAIVCDEAHVLFNAKTERPELGNSIVSETVRFLGEFKTALIAATQEPSSLSSSLLANCFNQVMFSLSNAKDIEYMKKTIGLHTQHIEYFSYKAVQKGVAVLKSGKLPRPTLIKTWNFPITKEDWVVEKFNKVVFKPKGEPVPEIYDNEFREKKKLSDDKATMDNFIEKKEKARTEKLDVLLNINKFPYLPLEERMKQLEYRSKSTWTNLIDQLVAEEYVKKVDVSLGYKKGKIVLLELTKKGAETIGTQDISPKGKGSIEHRFWQNQIKEIIEKEKTAQAWMEYNHSGKLIDVFAIKDGKGIAYEVAMSPGYEITNIKKDIEICTEVVVVCKNQIIMDQIRSQCGKTLSFSDLEKLSFLLVSDFV